MQSDNQLIRKIKRRQNREAADLLIGRYYKEIFAFTYRQTGNRELAMDLTQEIFITICQGIRSFDEKKSTFRTWAYRVASNKITDYYRSLAHKKQSMEVAFLSQEQEQSHVGILEDEYEDSKIVSDVSELIITRETIQEVMAVIVKFDMEWIQIFQKKCFHEMTFAEIAKDLDLSVNTVKTRFYTMLRKVKQEVAQYE
ncbi:MAG: sigma-70 family RNA polymerase sigma factor [Lachnospiraceae bacterium]|nr:sigma-70 family RNA polymerase sigma factor [Lachnospiraceae bacterium]